MTRNGSQQSAPVDNGCGGSEQGPPAKDCGTKKFAGLKTRLDYALASRVRDNLEVRAENADSPFRYCPSGGTAFPQLLNTSDGKPMNLRLPRSELFNRKLGKIILVGRAKETQAAGEHTYTTTTRWVITLVRR